MRPRRATHRRERRQRPLRRRPIPRRGRTTRDRVPTCPDKYERSTVHGSRAEGPGAVPRHDIPGRSHPSSALSRLPSWRWSAEFQNVAGPSGLSRCSGDNRSPMAAEAAQAAPGRGCRPGGQRTFSMPAERMPDVQPVVALRVARMVYSARCPPREPGEGQRAVSGAAPASRPLSPPRGGCSISAAARARRSTRLLARRG